MGSRGEERGRLRRAAAVAPAVSYKITQKAEGACDRDGESGRRRDARFAC